MSDTLNLAVRVLALTDAGCCVMKTTATSTSEAFWLGRFRGATYVEEPAVGKTGTVLVPLWAAKYHPVQLGAEIESCERELRQARTEYARPHHQAMEAAVAIESKDMTGVLFRTDESKRKSDKWPTHDGHVIVHGEKLFLSAWVKESKDGVKYFSLALKPAEQKDAPKNGTAKRPAGKAAVPADDSIPF